MTEDESLDWEAEAENWNDGELFEPRPPTKTCIMDPIFLPARQLYPLVKCNDFDLLQHSFSAMDSHPFIHKIASKLLLPAARFNRRRMIEFLIAEGADPNDARDIFSSKSALHLAAMHGSLDAIELLLWHGAAVDAQDDLNEQPIHKARNDSALKMLLEHGANPNARDYCGETALHKFCYPATTEQAAEYEKSCRHLLSWKGLYSIDVSARNSTGRTPLHIAAAYASQRLIDMLLKHGADMSSQDEFGETPLFQASFKAIPFLVRQAGVDPNIRNKNGQTVLHKLLCKPDKLSPWFCSLQHRFDAIEALLLVLRNDVPDANGKVPIELACENGDLDAIYLLFQRGIGDGTIAIHHKEVTTASATISNRMDHVVDDDDGGGGGGDMEEGDEK